MEPTISQERRLVLAEPALADMADAFNPSQFKPPQRKARLQSRGVNGAVQAPVLACRNTQQRAGCVQEHSAGGARQPQAANCRKGNGAAAAWRGGCAAPAVQLHLAGKRR